MLEQSVPEGLQPMEGTHAGAVHEELQPVGRTHVGEVHEGLPLAGDTPWGSRGQARSPPPPEEEGAAETRCEELTPTPIPRHQGEKVERTGSGVEVGRREGWGEAVLRFGFYFLISLF